MTGAVLIERRTRWYCPNCRIEDETTVAQPHGRFHTCRALYGLTAPLVQQGVKAKVEAVDRDDYVGSEIVQKDGRGRPVMAVRTTRDNGQDTAVYAPLARVRVSMDDEPERALEIMHRLRRFFRRVTRR